MKKIKFVLIAAFSVAAFTLPFMITSHSQAAGPLTCNFETTEGCDLGLTKQVSINGSDFVSTETPDAAPPSQGW
jgi:hypothetical protein